MYLDIEAKQYKIEELKYYYRYYLDEQGVSIIPKLMEAIEKEKASIRNQCIEIAYGELKDYIEFDEIASIAEEQQLIYWKNYLSYIETGYYPQSEISFEVAIGKWEKIKTLRMPGEKDIRIFIELFSQIYYLAEQGDRKVIETVCSDCENINWFYNWIIYSVKMAELCAHTEQMNSKIICESVITNLELLLQDTEVFKGEPRTCDLYFLQNELTRIKQNERKEYPTVYWSFWGDLQYELLRYLPEERISPKAKELLRILDRRFHKVPLRYCNGHGHSGWVKSPVSGKNIGKGQWLQIITNSKLKNRDQHRWIEVKGGFIESSYEAYTSDFQLVVEQHPQEMIELVLNNKERVLPAFVDSLFLGVEVSEKLEDLDSEVIERLLIEFPCNMKGHRASYFCGIVEKISNVNWSLEVMEQLMNIALKHCNPELDKPNVTNSEDKEMKSCNMLHNNALNCVRGSAARAIGHLLWEDKETFLRFKDVIEGLTKDENPAVRFASLYALWPSYNIDREWAAEKILYLYESDIRMASFYNSKNMFFLLYPKYKEKIILIIEKCFESEDKQLVEIGGHAVCEFYIQHNEFEKIIISVQSKSEAQIKAILDMAVVYLQVDDYRNKAKDIILTYKNIDTDIEIPLTKMFYDKYVDAKRDKVFLREFMKTKVSRRTVWAFVRYLEESAVSVVDYADIIIQLCENVLHMEIEDLRKQWGIEDEISKLIISLYDETVNSSKTIDKQIADKCLNLWDRLEIHSWFL